MVAEPRKRKFRTGIHSNAKLYKKFNEWGFLFPGFVKSRILHLFFGKTNNYQAKG
jgi:hypothetical protein